MTDIKDNFMKQMDNSETGIKARIRIFNQKLEKVDPELYEHLVKEGIDPHFYALRWILLMLT